MMKCKPWEIWLVDVEYQEKIGSKKRPVVVVSDTQMYILGFMFTSQNPKNYLPGEYQVMNWSEAGLKAPSVIRCSRQLKLQESSLLKRIGVLKANDIIGLQAVIQFMGYRE